MIPGWKRCAEYIAANPGCTALEIARACRTMSHTKRISEARRHGWEIECDKDKRYTAKKVAAAVETTEENNGNWQSSAPSAESGDTVEPEGRPSFGSPFVGGDQGTLDF